MAPPHKNTTKKRRDGKKKVCGGGHLSRATSKSLCCCCCCFIVFVCLASNNVKALMANKRKTRSGKSSLKDVSYLQECRHDYEIKTSILDQRIEDYFEGEEHEEAEKEDRTLPPILYGGDKKQAKSGSNYKPTKFTARLARHPLTTDRCYLQTVPKGKFYHLVALEQRMREEGVIRHRHEVDGFWETANKNWKSFSLTDKLDEENLKQILTSAIHSNEPNRKVKAVALSENKKKIKLPTIVESRISTTRPESRPICFPSQPKLPKLHTCKLQAKPKPKFQSCVPKYLDLTAAGHVNAAKRYVTCQTGSSNDGYLMRSMEHRMRCQAYQVAIVNSAFTRSVISRSKIGNDMSDGYSVADLLTYDDQNSHHDDDSDHRPHLPLRIRPSGYEKNSRTFITENDSSPPPFDHWPEQSRTRSDINLITFHPFPKINEKNFENLLRKPDNEERCVKCDEIDSRELHHHPLSFNDMLVHKDDLQVKEMAPSRKMWSNYATS